jgi:hypothetical protein
MNIRSVPRFQELQGGERCAQDSMKSQTHMYLKHAQLHPVNAAPKAVKVAVATT